MRTTAHLNRAAGSPRRVRTSAFFLVPAALLGGLVACATGGGTDNLPEPSAEPQTSDMTSPPTADVRPTRLEAHGDVRIDNYYWLKEREDPDVLAYLEAENAYTARMMEPTEELQATLYDELVARIQEDDSTVPVPNGRFEYFSKTKAGAAYPIHCRQPRGGGPDEVLFDVNSMARGLGYFSIGTRATSPDQNLIAYAVDRVGRRIYDIEIKHLVRGDIERGIKGTSGNVVWAEDGRTIFYTKRDPETLRSFQVWKHRLETSATTDELVYEETDPEFSCYVTKTRSKRFLTIVSSQTLTTEVRVLDATTPDGEWRVVLPREEGHEYSLDHGGDHFYFLTNKEAENFRLVSAPTDAPSEWTEVVPHSFEALISDVDVFAGHMVTKERRGGLVRLVVRPVTGGPDFEPFEIPFSDPTYQTRLTGNAEFETDRVRYAYSSLNTPGSVLEFNVESRETRSLKQDAVGGGFDAENYASERIFAEAKDGTAVPISIVYRKDRADGPGPLLLYAYGSYGSSMDASFNRSVLSLVDRGFCYAIAHVRGGQELGRAWYENGKLMRKKNTFTDFIACGEFLVKEGFTTPDQLFALGGSAGGLLVGAVANMAPELFKGMVAAVPFVDVVTTMLDDTIPLTTFEYDEWGNPNEEDAYRYMLSYSPYDQVKAQSYPDLLVTTGLHDSQVQYWEPAKWVAKLRAMKQGDSLLLFDCEMEAGHGGKSGRYDRLKKTAQMYAFMLSRL